MNLEASQVETVDTISRRYEVENPESQPPEWWGYGGPHSRNYLM